MRKYQNIAGDHALIVALAGLLAVAVYLLSCIPYEYAEVHAPEGSMFIGQVAVGDDVNSYYSFIRQAAEGHWLFRNAMTHMEHDAIFVNLEWLLLGWGMALFDWSTRAVFEVWRISGAFMILLAFAALALVTLPTRRERIIALLMFAFGGGFGWFIYLLALAGVIDINSGPDITNPAFDLSTAPHPFGQIVKNPHFALPHGTFLVVVACYAVAEKTSKRSRYCWAAVAAVLHGLIRPYDLISLFAILPTFIVVEIAVKGRVDLGLLVKRTIPLLAMAPLLVYYVYIFSYHPIFKYWASQGVQPPVPVVWHLLGFGLAGVLCLWRLCRFTRYPLTSSCDRLLAVWVIVLLVMFHGNRVLSFMPYTPQLGVPLVTPMIVLGVAIFRRAATGTASRAGPAWVAGILVFLVVNALSTPLYLIRACEAAVSSNRNYIEIKDLEAIRWLGSRVRETDVIVADYPIGTKLGQFLDGRVLIGHWALTPHIEEMSARADRFLAGQMDREEATSFLEGVRARYIYVSPRNERAGPEYFQRLPGLNLEFENAGVMVFTHQRDDL